MTLACCSGYAQTKGSHILVGDLTHTTECFSWPTCSTRVKAVSNKTSVEHRARCTVDSWLIVSAV